MKVITEGVKNTQKSLTVINIPLNLTHSKVKLIFLGLVVFPYLEETMFEIDLLIR